MYMCVYEHIYIYIYIYTYIHILHGAVLLAAQRLDLAAAPGVLFVSLSASRSRSHDS